MPNLKRVLHISTASKIVAHFRNYRFFSNTDLKSARERAAQQRGHAAVRVVAAEGVREGGGAR